MKNSRFSHRSEISGKLDLCDDKLELGSSRMMSKAEGSMPVMHWIKTSKINLPLSKPAWPPSTTSLASQVSSSELSKTHGFPN